MTTRQRKKSEGGKDEIEYMDKTEQEAFIAKLLEDNEQSTQRHKRVLGWIALLLGIGKLYLFLSQILYPFQIAPHSDLINHPLGAHVAITEGISSLAFFGLYAFIHLEPGTLKRVALAVSFLPLTTFLF